MDIWISRCNRSAECQYCHENITVGEPEVFGKLWRKYNSEGGEPRTWTRTFHWHAKRSRDGQCCWLEQGLEEFGKKRHVEKRGRKKILLPKEQRDQRLAVLRKRAKVVQQLKAEAEKPPEEQNVETLVHLGEKLEDLRQQISLLGGVPKSWE